MKNLRRIAFPALAGLAAALPAEVHASFLSGDTLDSVCNFLAWFIIIVVPIVGIGIFLAIHVIPEKIAEHTHHPQQAAIKTLCFLSLVFGGMLWPAAWLWAFTRPVGYRAVYGTDKHENYFIEMGEKAERGELTAAELQFLREEVAAVASKGALPLPLRGLPAILESARPKDAAAVPAAGGAR
jgi:hypothetical protein